MLKIKWTNEEIDALKELVKIYGDHRPSDICHQLKHIYGIDKSRKQVMSRCKLINNYYRINDISQDQVNEIWELYKIKENKFTSYHLETNLPKYKWAKLLFSNMKKCANTLNNTFASNKGENRNRIRKISLSIWTEALKLSKEKLPKEDKIYNDVVKSCKKWFELLDPLMKNEVEAKNIFEFYEFKLNRFEIQTILEHIFLIRRIKDIINNDFEINEDNEMEIDDEDDKDDDEDDDEDDDNKKQPIKFKLEQSTKLSKQEVDVLRRSQLYLRLQPENPRKFFYDWYNSAVKNHENDSQFTIVFCDNEKKVEIKKELRLDEKQKSNKLPIWKKIKRQRDQQISEWSQRFLKDLEFE